MNEFFSQNSEDVLLARCFERQNKGFYVDVGAEDPRDGSVTKRFYDQGWRGVNIEPVPFYFERLQHYRPRDLNVQCPASAVSGVAVELDVVEHTGLSSIERDRKDLLTLQSQHNVRTISVTTRTLNEILDWAQLPWIDFLKVDVEGHELSVLQGLDFSRFRPKIMLVETTDPLIHGGGRVAMNERPKLAKDFKAIASHVEAAGYTELYFDGLNTWWADQELSMEESANYKQAFSTPVNVFDSISPMDQGRVKRLLNRRIELLTRARQGDRQALYRQYQAAAELNAMVVSQAAELNAMALKLEDALLHLDQLQQSTSWKLTKPYRQLGEQWRKLRG